MLAVLYPVGLWMLRWVSAGRTPEAADVPEIIAALDRGQGFGPLAGSKQRRRIRLLAQLGDLERLVAWYGRQVFALAESLTGVHAMEALQSTVY